jgi:hypothetical protein
MIFGSLQAAGWLHLRKLKKASALLSFLFLMAIGSLHIISPPSGHTQDAGPELFQRSAEVQMLSENRYWQILLHYKPDFFGRTVSLIDDPDFFLAVQGQHDPAAELNAALNGLWQNQSPDLPNEHVRCKFPARSQWLIDTLAIDTAILPPVVCQELDEALEHVQPRSAVLIFPGNHNNSPASMFGHTLISVEGPYRSRLLAYAINYAAHTDETNGFAYAVKGIFGLYPGYYSLLPYYVKVREYNDLERRDVWEYELNLSQEETRRMTLHIWELRDMSSEYFFFDENCSYNLLFLLEAGRPSLNLTDPCRPWVIPIDTVRIVEEAGLVDRVAYRPSKATRIQTLAKQMNRQETAMALEVIDEELTANHVLQSDLSREGKIRVLDVASETLEFRYYREEVEREAYREKSLALLKGRSQLGQTGEGYLEIPDPGRPDQGHGSNRLSLGVGLWDNDWYQELRIRPAYHNLLDADQGFLPGSQIDFANLALRLFPERHKLQLQRLDLINIVSLSPRHAFYSPVSWKVSTGFQQALFDDQDDHLVYQLNPGGGFTWGDNHVMCYGLVETDLLVSGRFRDSFALGLGTTIGLLANPFPDWKVHLTARKIWYEAGDPHRAVDLAFKQNWRLTSNTSIELDISRQRSFSQNITDATILFNLYW